MSAVTFYVSDDDASIILDENEMRTEYDNFLDECYGPVEIAGYTYDVSETFKRVDPVAYRCGFSDYAGNGFEEISVPLNIAIQGGDVIKGYAHATLGIVV